MSTTENARVVSTPIVTQHSGDGGPCYFLLQRWYERYIEESGPGVMPTDDDTWNEETEHGCLHLLLNKHVPHCTAPCLLLHLQCIKCLLRRLGHPYQLQEHYPAIPPMYCNTLYRLLALKPIPAPWKDRRGTVHHLFLALQNLLSSPHLPVRYAAEQCLELWLYVLAPPAPDTDDEDDDDDDDHEGVEGDTSRLASRAAASWLQLSRGNLETRSAFAIYLLWLLEPVFVRIHPREHDCTIPSHHDVIVQGWGALRVVASVLSRRPHVASEHDPYLILCDLALSGSNLIRDCYHALRNVFQVHDAEQKQGGGSKDTATEREAMEEDACRALVSQDLGLHVQSIITYLGILSYVVSTPPPFPDGPPAGSLKVVSCAVIHASGVLTDLRELAARDVARGQEVGEAGSLSRDLYNAIWKFVWDTREHVLFDYSTGLADAILSSQSSGVAGHGRGHAGTNHGESERDSQPPDPWPEVILHAARIALNAITGYEHSDTHAIIDGSARHTYVLQQIAQVLEHTQLFHPTAASATTAQEQGGGWEEVDDDEISRRLLAAMSMYEVLIPFHTPRTRDTSDTSPSALLDGLCSTWHPVELMYKFLAITTNDVSVALDMLMDDGNGDLLSFILRFLTIMTGSLPLPKVVGSVGQQHEQAVRTYVRELVRRLEQSHKLGTFPYNVAPLVRRMVMFLNDPE